MKKLILFITATIAQTSFGMHSQTNGIKIRPAIFVNFVSIGTGVDRETKKYVKELIGDAQKEDLLDQLTASRRGFEGEELLCVRFKEINDGSEFVKLVAAAILENKMTNDRSITQVLIGSSCHRPQDAKEFDPNYILNSKPSLSFTKVSSDVMQTCYTDEGVSPQITTFLKQRNDGKGYTLLINHFEEGQPETLLSSGYRPVVIEQGIIQNPLFEISLKLTPLLRSGLKSRNFAEGTFTDPATGNVVRFEKELECAVRSPENQNWIFTAHPVNE